MGKPWEGFTYQTSSWSDINGQPCDVCAGSTSQIVSSRDSFPVHLDLCLSAVKFWMLIQCLILGLLTNYLNGMVYSVVLLWLSMLFTSGWITAWASPTTSSLCCSLATDLSTVWSSRPLSSDTSSCSGPWVKTISYFWSWKHTFYFIYSMTPPQKLDHSLERLVGEQWSNFEQKKIKQQPLHCLLSDLKC